MEGTLLRLPDAGSGDVGGQQVGGALDPVERAAQAAAEGPGQCGLAAPRDVIDQDVAAGEQRDRHQLDRPVAAADHPPYVVDDRASGAVRGRAALASLGAAKGRMGLAVTAVLSERAFLEPSAAEATG